MGEDATATAEEPPGPDGLPFVGATRAFASDRLGFLTRMAEEYGDVVRIPVAGGESFYALFHPDHVRHVLVEYNEDYVKGEVFQRQLELLGEGVLNAEGEAWRRQRRMVEPAFHPDRIEGYAEPMVAYTERLLDEYEDGAVRNVHEDATGLTLEVVAKALFDVDLREAEAEVGDALAAVMEQSRRRSARVVDVPDWVPTHGNREYRHASRTLEDVVDDIVDERRRATGDASGADDEVPGDVVSMLLAAEDEAGEGMSDETVRDEVMTLLLAGHETTAQALTYTLYLLARHPRVEQRLVAELDDVLGGSSPTVDDLDDLAYTERVVREAMRLYPPVWGILREATADDVVGGYRIPEGATVGLFQWVTHRDPRFYDDPVAFDPDRWTESFREGLHPFAYFPFGGGPRRCLGDRFALQEARLVVATLLQQVHFEALRGEELDLAPAITLRPADGLRMRVRER